VRCVPPLPVHNRFSCLNVENETPQVLPVQTGESVIVAPKVLPSFPKVRKPCRIHLCKWEKWLPKKYVMASTPGPSSLVIKVEIQTMDTAEVKMGPALVDSEATLSFMSQSYVECNQLNTRKLTWPIPVHNMDSSLNEDGSITQIVDAILHIDGHSERTTFAVTNLSKLDIILGFTWIAEHNPEINWQTRKVTLSCVGRSNPWRNSYCSHRTKVQPLVSSQ